MFTPPSAAERRVTQSEAERAWDVLSNCGPFKLVQAHARHPLRGFAAEVNHAFRLRLREVHPDAGGDAAAALRAARDTLLRWLEQAPKADCKECGGSGFVFGKLAVKPCSRCGA
jgi:predicted Zn-ribbon and HTH transcriptional regulator